VKHTDRVTGWRRVAGLIWDAPSDPQIYGAVDVDAGGMLSFIQQANEAGAHVTPTHLVGRAVGHALAEVPALNVRLVGGRAIPRGSVDVFFITSTRRGHDLSGVKIRDIGQKSALQVAAEVSAESQRLREGDDPALADAKRRLESLPRPLARAVLRVAAWAAGDHALRLPGLGVEASPFGSAIVSSVGMFGLPMGFAPIAWMYRVPLLLLVGKITERAVAVDGSVRVRPMLSLGVTVDHRYVDGSELGAALSALERYLCCPANHELEPTGGGRTDGTMAPVERA
jgi:pyruvate/2-oxoglutarate dehydrogenase complex dihydrolipoamide acyltransferase (E2) component